MRYRDVQFPARFRRAARVTALKPWEPDARFVDSPIGARRRAIARRRPHRAGGLL